MKLKVISLSLMVLSGCASVDHSSTDRVGNEGHLRFVSSCAPGPLKPGVSDAAAFFDGDLTKSPNETDQAHEARIKSKVPEYITLEKTIKYATYDADHGVLKTSTLGLTYPGPASNPFREGRVVVELEQRLSNARTFMGETAYGLQREVSAGRQDRYLASIGTLTSNVVDVGSYRLVADIQISPSDVRAKENRLLFMFTIKTVAPYLTDFRKHVSTATIQSPSAVATYTHMIVGDLCSARVIDPDSGKEYPASIRWTY